MYNHKSETHKQNLVLVLKPKSRNSQLFLRYTIALILLFINPLLIDIMLPFTTLTHYSTWIYPNMSQVEYILWEKMQFFFRCASGLCGAQSLILSELE